MAPLSAGVERWLRCREKRCCFDADIFVTGADVTRIARTISVPPWLFTVPVPCDAAADDAFVLAPAGPRYRLALGRTHFPGEDPHCAFLVRLPDGSTRCGLGELRPRTCRDWPLKGPTPLCTCDWSDIAGDDDSPVAEPVQRDVERDRYAGVVAGWNAYVEASGGEQLTHRDFCRHILGAYPAET